MVFFIPQTMLASIALNLQFRHCEERQRRGNLQMFDVKVKDCFASLAMTAVLGLSLIFVTFRKEKYYAK
jgi:hypothetical protein